MDPRYSAPKNINRKVGTEYLKTKIQVADRLELLLITYEEVINAAANEDAEKIKKACELLINSLDLDHATEFGIGLLRLYKYCIIEADKGKFADITKIFVGLRDAWRILQMSQVKDDK